MIVPELAEFAVPVDSLRPMPGNPRRGDVQAVAASLRTFGQRKPIVVRAEDRTITAGNHTWLAAKELGWSEIAAVELDDDETTARGFALADNRTAELGGYDEAALAALLREVDNAGLLPATGWTDDELRALLDKTDATPAANTDPDAVPEAPPAPRTQNGDVWQLGDHRLVCGDAAEAETWQALLHDGEQVSCVWTDPPYGVDYVGGTSEALTIQNDGRDQNVLRVLLAAVFGQALGHCHPGAAWYVCAATGPATLASASLLAELGLWRQTLVWVKDQFVLGHSDYHYRHEFIYQGYGPNGEGRRGRGGGGWYGPDNADSVLEVDRPRASRDHPTMKPVELIVRGVENSSRPGDLIADPFGGSGSTLIAAHHTRRSARLIELDARYVDVICRRWQEHTGDKPVLEESGEPADFTS